MEELAKIWDVGIYGIAHHKNEYNSRPYDSKYFSAQ